MREIRLVLMVHASIMRDVSNVEVGHYLLTRITTYYSLLTARFLLLTSHLLVLTSLRPHAAAPHLLCSSVSSCRSAPGWDYPPRGRLKISHVQS